MVKNYFLNTKNSRERYKKELEYYKSLGFKFETILSNNNFIKIRYVK